MTKYAGLVCAQAHRQELIQDLYKTWHDPVRGTVSGGMIRYNNSQIASVDCFLSLIVSFIAHLLLSVFFSCQYAQHSNIA